jgi:hypothetical protein
MPSINNFLKGFSDGLPGMKDYQHASRLYLDDNFKLAPKNKFLFHVVFDIDNTVVTRPFTGPEQLELNMLVKTCQLPKYNLNYEEKLQYNKKTFVATRIQYQPVNISFHDDQADTVNAFWKSYYEYNIADPVTLGGANNTVTNFGKDTMYESGEGIPRQFGMDNAKQRKKPLLRGIQIFVLHRKKFTSFTLVNPVITSFSHDDLDQADGAGIMSNTMQVMYESVLYRAGNVNKNDPRGFATLHYDNEPSPLSVLGRGTTSIFGPGGIVDGVGSVIGDVANNNISLGTILTGINTYNNAKKVKAKDVKEELKGISKTGVREVGKNAGTITNPVGSFSVGTAAIVAGVGITLAGAKGGIDNKNNTSRVINNPIIDTQNYLSPTEAFNLLQTNLSARDRVAAGIYYQRNGSRNGLSIAQSDVEFASSSVAVKNIYRNRALSDITKLVNEGYIKINRTTNEVSIVAEKAGL